MKKLVLAVAALSALSTVAFAMSKKANKDDVTPAAPVASAPQAAAPAATHDAHVPTATVAAAHVSHEHKHVKISGAHATIMGSQSGAVFMKIENTGKEDDKVIKASSKIAGVVELHTHEEKDGKHEMKKIDHIEVKAGSHVELASGGLHLMLMELKPEAAAAKEVEITVDFEKAGAVELKVPVNPAATH